MLPIILRKVFLFTSFSLLFSGFIYAQPAVFWGPELEDEKGDEIIEIFGHSNEYFISLKDTRKKRDGYLLEKINTESLERMSSRKISFPQKDKINHVLEFPMSLSTSSYLVASTERAKDDTVLINAFRIGDDLNISNPILLGKTNKASIVNQDGFSAFSNEEKTRVILIIPLEHVDHKNEKFEVKLFDSEMNLLKSKKLEVPHSSEHLNYVDAIIDSEGTLYVLASIRDESLDNPDGSRNLAKDFSLFTYDWETEELVEKSLSLGNRWLYDVRLLINSQKNLQVVGYFSTMVDLIMAGTFSLEIEPKNGDIVNQGITTFDRDFRSRFRPNANRARETELGKFNLDYVFKMSNQGIQLVSEKSYVETTNIWNPTTNTYQTITIYNYDEVLLTSINPDSKIQFNVVVPKYQSSNTSGSRYTSYLSFRRGPSTCIVYNDHFRNGEIPISSDQGYRQLSSPNNAELFIVIIDDKGNTKKVSLKDMRDANVSFNSRYSFESDEHIVLVANSPYKTQYFKIKLD